jgi:hypothetical protein
MFLNSNVPESLVLAVLCGFKEKKPNKVINKKLLKISISKKKFDDYVLMLEELSLLRNLQEVVKENEMILANKVKWEDLPSYEIGMEKGVEMEKEQVIINSYKFGIKIDDIAKIVELTPNKVKIF